MTRFMVFEPPAAKIQGEPRPSIGASERATFVRDGFSVWAFLFPWIWLLRYGLFVSALVAFGAFLGLGYLAQTGRGLLAVPLFLLLGLLVALEGPSLRARRFLRRRFRDMGAVNAANLGEASILYFAGHMPSRTPQGRANGFLPWGFEPARAPAAARRRWWFRMRKGNAT